MSMSNDPPFTVTRYGSLGAAICAERDWLRTRVEKLEQAARALIAREEFCQECGMSSTDEWNALSELMAG
jgi:hypothetical protein